VLSVGLIETAREVVAKGWLRQLVGFPEANEVHPQRHAVVGDLPPEGIQEFAGGVALGGTGEFVWHAAEPPHRKQRPVLKQDDIGVRVVPEIRQVGNRGALEEPGIAAHHQLIQSTITPITQPVIVAMMKVPSATFFLTAICPSDIFRAGSERVMGTRRTSETHQRRRPWSSAKGRRRGACCNPDEQRSSQRTMGR
jgi:hypothetical protein